MFGYCVIPLWRCCYKFLDLTESYVAHHALDKHSKPKGTLLTEVRRITYSSQVWRPLEAVPPPPPSPSLSVALRKVKEPRHKK
jgi:hypothetical protein